MAVYKIDMTSARKKPLDTDEAATSKRNPSEDIAARMAQLQKAIEDIKTVTAKSATAPSARASALSSSAATPRQATEPPKVAAANTNRTPVRTSLPVTVAKTGVANLPVPAKAPKTKLPRAKASKKSWRQHVPEMGVGATAAWLAGSVIYLSGAVGWSNLINMPAHQLGSVIAGIAAPLALIWMGVHYLRRQDEFKAQMSPLLKQIDQLINPNRLIETRISAVTDALRRQANELVTAAERVEKSLNHVRDGLRGDMEKMLEYAGLTGKHLEQASLSVANRTTHLARLTEQMHGRLVTFEQHAKSGTDRLDQSVEQMMGRANETTGRLEKHTNTVIASMHAANSRLQKTADDLDTQIGQIAHFADETAQKFGAVAGQFSAHQETIATAGDVIEAQMNKLDSVLSKQLDEMGQAIRDFAAVGGDLSGTMTDFRTQAEEAVAAAKTQIHTLTHKLDQHLQDAQGALDRTAGAALSKVDRMDDNLARHLVSLQQGLEAAAASTPMMVKEILDDTAHKLTAMEMRFARTGSQVATQIVDIESRVNNKLEALHSLAGKIGTDAEGGISRAMRNLFVEINEIKDHFADSAKNTNTDLRLFHNELAQTIEALSHVARRATDRTMERILTLNAGISQRIMDLRTTAESAAGQGQKLETSLAQHIGILRQTSDELTHHATRIETKGGAIVSRMEQTTGNAAAQTEIMSHIIARETDQLQHAADAAAATITGAAVKMDLAGNELYAAASHAVRDVNAMIVDLEAQQNRLDITNDMADDTRHALSAQIDELRGASKDLMQQLSVMISENGHQLSDINKLTTRTGQVTMGLKAALTMGANDLDVATDRVAQQTQESRKVLGEQSREMAALSGQIVGDTKRVTNELSLQRHELSTIADGALATLQTVNADLKQQTADVTIASERAAQDLAWLNQQMSDGRTAIAEMADHAADRLIMVRKALHDGEAAIVQAANDARQQMSEVSSQFTVQSENISVTAQNIRDSYDSAIAQLEQVGMKLSSEAFQAFDSLSEMGTTLETRFAQLNTGSSEANDLMQMVAEQLQGNYTTLSTTAQQAATQLAAVNDWLAKNSDDLQITNSQTESRFDLMRTTLGDYAQDLVSMAAAAGLQMEAASDKFVAQAQIIATAMQGAESAANSSTAHVRSEFEAMADRLMQSTKQSGHYMTDAVAQLQNQAQQLTKLTGQSAQEIENQTVRLGAQAGILAEKTQRAAKDVASTSGAITQQITELGQHTQQAAADLSKASVQLDKNVVQIKSVAEKAGTLMVEASQALMRGAEQVTKSSQAAHTRVQTVVDAIAKQITELTSATTVAANMNDKLAQNDAHTRRDAFLGAAKYIIETLNSLSVDLTRVLDPAMAEKTWKEFYKGDAAAFTRRILAMRDDVPATRLREKFEAESEFRTYVQRYFRQFEELFEQAVAIDHNDLLSTTLTTSDVGKLYTYLATALGHNRLRPVKKAA